MCISESEIEKLNDKIDSIDRGLNIKMNLVLDRLEILENKTISKMTKKLVDNIIVYRRLNTELIEELKKYRDGK